MANLKKNLLRVLKITGKIFLGIIILLLLIVLFVRSPWGQNIIKNRIISSIEKNSEAKISLERIFIQFDGDIEIEELLIQEADDDTIIYSESISANISLWPLINSNSFNLNDFDAQNLKANIIRKDSVSGFNYEMLMGSSSNSQSQTQADTTSGGMSFKIGDLDLKQFDINFQDGVTGMDSEVRFEELSAEFEEFDLEKMVFRLGDVSLQNADLKYAQIKPLPESEDTGAPLPLIAVENLELSNTRAVYNSKPDGIFSNYDIAELQLEQGQIDLEKMEVSGQLFSLNDSEVVLNMKTGEESVQNNEGSIAAFTWPEWVINWKQIDLRNNEIGYFVNGKEIQAGRFESEAVKLDSLILRANDIVYKDKTASAEIQEIKFQEASGINMNQFQVKALISDEKMQFQDLRFAGNGNSLSATADITYPSMNEFIQDPGNARLDGNFENLKFDPKEIYRFQPQLRNNEYVKAISSSPVSGNVKISGRLERLNFSSLDLNWASTSINASGTLMSLQQPERLQFELPNARLNTQRNDLLKFVEEQQIGIKLPEDIRLSGSFSGGTSEIQTNSTLITSDGSIKVDGKFNTGEKIVFDASVQGDSIALGKLLQNDQLGEIQLNIEATGQGSTLDALDANLNSTIKSFTYNNYEFREININGKFENGTGPINLDYKDNNLNMQAETLIELNDTSPRIEFMVNMEGADLGGLEITRKNIKTGFKLEGWYQGDGSSYEVKADIIDGIAVYNNKTYLLGNFNTFAYVRPDTTSVDIKNRMINLELQSNADPVAFSQALNRHFKRYITEGFQEDTVTNPVNIRLNAHINEAPILNEVFLVNLEDMDSIDINMDFQEKERNLTASVNVPYINYYNSEIDSLQLDIASDPDDLNFELAFDELNGGPLAIKKTVLSGQVIDRKLNLDFSSMFDKDSLVHVSSVLNFQGDTLKFHLEPKNLILNGNPWQVAENNQLSIAQEYLNFKDFILSRNDQEMQLSNEQPGQEKEVLRLDFRNFKLATLLNYLNPETELATGQLDGNLVYEEPFGKTGLIADMNINQFKVMGVDLNTLSLQGNSAGFSTYDFEMAVKGGEVDLDLTGSYVADETSAKLDMNLDLNKVQMSALEGFSQGEIKNASGSFSGNIGLNGTLAEPEYQGQLNFKDAKFNLAFLNAPFILPDESLSLDNDGFYFDNFQIDDTNNNSVVINGKVTTENFLNPGFDLDVQAENFNLLNSTAEDNELFYGKAVVDVDAQIQGDLNLPEVNMDLDIKEATDFIYVIPDNQLQMNQRDGVVIFVNKENPDDILTQTEEESYIISGYEISSRISVSPGAAFTVILNEETGDKFQVQGEGDLLFNMYPNGRLSLTGIYNINDGFYEMSLYNLVKRRFRIADGSRVSWAGDPYDAQLDVRAIYEVEASASGLMQNQLSGADAQVRSQYGRQLPFFVYLNVDGELMEPKISFALDMPENEQGAVGGQVYGRVQQLNSQEQELNKQVFSLLVLNRFFPAGGSDGSTGGTLSVARDNLSQALSDQLNMLSSRILGESGLQLNFEVDSFTGYEGQDRTQLGISAQKAFLEDRLIVEVGSQVDIQGSNQAPGQEAAPVIGNVSVSYLIEEDGTWRIKGFSKNQYENVIDGQLVVSGIALIFTKEFNKFKNIFEKAVMEEVGKEGKKKDKEENQSQSNPESTDKDEN